MIARLLAILLLLVPVSASAQSLDESLAGSWALRLDGAIIFRFDIERDGTNWRGTWSRPANFASDGDRFANFGGGTEKVASRENRELGGWLELVFPDDRPGAVPDIFRFRTLGADRMEMIYAETGLAPYVLEKVAGDALLGPFQAGKIYRRSAQAASQPWLTPQPPEEPDVQGPPALIGR